MRRGTVIAAAVGALATFIVVAPIATAVVMLRCCDDVRGPGAGAWVVVGLTLVMTSLVGGAAVAAAFVAGRRLLARRGRGR